MTQVGLYFGTFNPVHVGHLVIANYMADYTDLDEVWLVVSPQNPLKEREDIMDDHTRLAMVQEAIADNPKLKVSNIEFNLPKPSYTIDTLNHISQLYPEFKFSVIMGEDNLRTLHKWKGFKDILDKHHLFVYPRVLTEQEKTELEAMVDTDNELLEHPQVTICEAPVMKVSATFIRQGIKDGKDVRYLLTEPVFRYIQKNSLYQG